MGTYYNPNNPSEKGQYAIGSQPKGWVLDTSSLGGQTSGSTIPIGSTKTYGIDVYQWDGTRWFDTGLKDTTQQSDPSRFLGAQGYNWIEGSGPSALWQTPDGRIVTQDIANQLATKSLTTAPTSNAITPYQSSQLGLGYAQLQQTGELGWARIEQEKAQLQAQMARDAQTWALQSRQIADAEAANAFLRTKSQFEMSQGLTREANETQQRLFENQVALRNMQNQRDTLQAQMQMQAATENARNALATQQANLQYQAQREARLQSLAGDIGKLAADPGSRAQLAATMLANRGFGQAAGALRQSQVTDESLQPLAQDLSLKKNIEGQPLNPYQYTPIVAPTLAPIDMSQFQLPKFVTTAPAPTAPSPTIGGTVPFTQTTPTDVAALSGQSGDAAQQAAISALQAQGYTMSAPSGEGGGMAKGGMTRAKNFLVGDSKDGTPTGYEEMIINPLNAPIGVVPNEMINRYRPPMPRFANGTADNPSGSVFGNEMQDTSSARSFLSEAIQRALAGTPWTTSSLPTSVYASTPGMDPSVVQLMASLNAQARGVPSETFLRQASLLAPAGLGQQVTRRTA